MDSSSTLSGPYPDFCEAMGKIPIIFQGIWTLKRGVRKVDHSQTSSAVLVANTETDFCEC